MSKLILIILLVFPQLKTNAQQNFIVEYRNCNNCGGQSSTCSTAASNDSENTNYTYGAVAPFLTSGISSDYGPRRLSSSNTYDWHGGIDYNSGAADMDRGDLLIAIRGGTTQFFVNGNMKSIGQIYSVVFDYINGWYNTKRIHSTLGGKSPSEMFNFLRA